MVSILLVTCLDKIEKDFRFITALLTDGNEATIEYLSGTLISRINLHIIRG